MKAYLGIDPGKSGGMAIVGQSDTPLAYAMPETEADILDVLHTLATYKGCEIIAAIEKVSSSPQQGVVSAFTFGMGYGGLRMALTALKIPWREVRPQVWQKELGCLTKGDKNVSKRRAQQLFPSLFKITHATADALLIAEWLRRQP